MLKNPCVRPGLLASIDGWLATQATLTKGSASEGLSVDAYVLVIMLFCPGVGSDIS